jgi:hypothetical protein
MKVFYIILFSLIVSAAFGQNQKCGLPNYLPKINEAHAYIDTCGKATYLFKRPKWYFQGTLNKGSIPYDTTYTGANGAQITISYTEAKFYNLSTNSYWDYQKSPIDGQWSWQNRQSFNLDSLLSRNNVWTGKNEFQDSLKAKKGIVSGGLVDTKGMKSTGDANNAAATLNGVVAEKDTIVSTNFTLTGAYGAIGFNCATGIKDCTLPPLSETIGWIFNIRKTDATSNILRIKDSNGTVVYTLYNDISIIFQNKNGSWKRKQ